MSVFNLFKDKDPLNIKKQRNELNTNFDDFNCAGYALETFSWYCPYNEEKHCGWDNGMDCLECIDYMIKDFKGKLRRIFDISELKKDEYVIAFRGSPEDFHFMKRNSNGL
jgi:hypothetical protein